AVLTALVFGMLPALPTSRRDVHESLRDSGKGLDGGFRGRRLRDTVVVVEVALSLTLLGGAGLLMRSFVALRDARLGLRADHGLQSLLAMPAERYRTPQHVAGFFEPLLARLAAVPGVVAAAAANGLPPYGGPEGRFEIAGRTSDKTWDVLLQ